MSAEQLSDALFSFAVLLLGLAALPIALGIAPNGPALAMVLSAIGAALAMLVIDAESRRSQIVAITAFALNIVSFWSLAIALAMGANLASFLSTGA